MPTRRVGEAPCDARRRALLTTHPLPRRNACYPCLNNIAPFLSYLIVLDVCSVEYENIISNGGVCCCILVFVVLFFLLLWVFLLGFLFLA